MRTEIPTCQRCCLCLPLRYGLITWGYFRLMIAGIFLLGISISLHQFLKTTDAEKEKYSITTTDIIILSILIPLVVADIILGIIFIIGCHKKNVKLMTKYYHYTIFLFALFIPLSLCNVGSTLYYLHKNKSPLSSIFAFVVLDLFSLCAYIVIQIYVALLIRSEIIKLNDSCQFRFENNAAEAECSLRIDDSIRRKEIKENKTKIDDNDVIKAEV